jgi:hypothetical protein
MRLMEIDRDGRKQRNPREEPVLDAWKPNERGSNRKDWPGSIGLS